MSLKSKKSFLLLTTILLVSFLAHVTNMMNFPYVENDEGTYLSQAWSFATEGELAPYTYWYDHAPAGWIFIALWTKLTGGFFTFGWSYETGRIFMLVLQIFNTFFVYVLTKKITRSSFAGLTASLLFSISPMAIYFHRRILLDNIMVFWMLLGYYLLLIPLGLNNLQEKIHPTKNAVLFVLSAIVFAISILTKESALIFVPLFFLIILYLLIKKNISYFLAASWVLLFIGTISLYPLYAFSRDELFSLDSPRSPDNAKVSLVDTFLFQTERSGDSFLSPESDFRTYFKEWMIGDHFVPIPDAQFFGGGLIAIFFCIYFSFIKKQPMVWLFILPALFYLVFLMRGGIIFNFYIIPLLPFLAMMFGFMIWQLVEKINMDYCKTKVQQYTVSAIIIFPLVIMLLANNELFLYDQVTPQIQAATSLMKTASSNDVLLIENYAFVDFRAPNKYNSFIPFPQAHFYWKIDTDPDIKWGVFDNDWRKADYILNLPQMPADIASGDLPLTREAFNHSTIIDRFEQAGIYTEVRRVDK